MTAESGKNGRTAAPGPAAELAVYRQDGLVCAVLLEDKRAVEYLEESGSDQICRQDIFLGKVIRTVDTLNAAFIDIGDASHGMLPLDQAQGRLRPGAAVIVQVKRLQAGDKGHVLTTGFELPGPFAVFRPGAEPKRRSKLLALAPELRDDLFRQDLARLETFWQNLLTASGSGKVPRRLASFGAIIDQALINFVGSNLQRIHVEGLELYNTVSGRLREILPQFLSLLRLHVPDSYSLPDLLGLADIRQERSRRVVLLKNGGRLTIDRTEAMTVIDVDSGGDTGGRPGEMHLRVNLLAAAEIVRQLRLRNLGGIIVIDFISLRAEQEQILLEAMRELLRRDRGRCRLLGFTRLGLLEMTRTPV